MKQVKDNIHVIKGPSGKYYYRIEHNGDTDTTSQTYGTKAEAVEKATAFRDRHPSPESISKSFTLQIDAG